MSDINSHWRLLHPSRYLCAADLRGKDATVVIEKVFADDLPLEGKSETKRGVILRFKGKQKALVANKTNLKTIAELHGPYTSDWLGKAITLFPTTTRFGRSTVECIRVRPKVKNGAAPAPDAEAPPAEEMP